MIKSIKLKKLIIKNGCFMNKKILAIIISITIFTISINLYGFEEGFIWSLKANFNESLTIPSINNSDLDKMGASFLKGSMGFTMDGEAELGYLFGVDRWFGGKKSDFSKFSGMSLYASIGVGSGFSGMVSGGTYAGVSPQIFINVNYSPIITFGIGSKLYLLESRLALGLQLGGKIIADTSPEYMVYGDSANLDTTLQLPAVGEIVVTDFMIKNMNPVMFSIKLMLEYNQPISERVEVVLGMYSRFNIYKPKYITMPDKLMNLIQEGAGKKDFTVETPMPSFYLNSFDFGLSLGLQFKG